MKQVKAFPSVRVDYICVPTDDRELYDALGAVYWWIQEMKQKTGDIVVYEQWKKRVIKALELEAESVG